MQAKCPRCDQTSDFPDSLAGTEIRCPACGGLIPLPGAIRMIVEDAAKHSDATESQEQQPASGESQDPPVGDSGSVFAHLDVSGVSDADVLGPRSLSTEKIKSGRKTIIGICVAVLLLLGGGGTALVVHLDRQAHAKKVEDTFGNADQAYSKGDMDGCSRTLDQALKLMSERPGTVEKARADVLSGHATKIKKYIGYWRQAVTTRQRAGFVPAEASRSLADQLKTVAALGSDAQPVAKLIESLAQQAWKLDLNDRHKRIDEQFSSVQLQLDQARFEAAKDALKVLSEHLEKIRDEMGRRLRADFSEKTGVLDGLIKLQEDLALRVKAAPPAGPKRQKLLAEIEKLKVELKPASPGFKGLSKQFEVWIIDLRKDKRPLPSVQEIKSQTLKNIGEVFAKVAPGYKLVPESTKQKKSIFSMSNGKNTCRIMACSIGGKPRLMLEFDGIRMAFPFPGKAKYREFLLRYYTSLAPTIVSTLRKSNAKEAWGNQPWDVHISKGMAGCQPTAFLTGKGYVVTPGKLWKVTGHDAKATIQQIAKVFIKATRDLETAIGQDKLVNKELQTMLLMMVKAAYRPRRSSSDHLPRQFCSEAVAKGYIKKNAPELAKRLRKELAAYRLGYAGITRFSPLLTGKTDSGDQLELSLNADGKHLWRIYDAGADTTTFAMRFSDPHYYYNVSAHTTFNKKHSSWPIAELPIAVNMVHHALGVISSWDPVTDKLTYDPELWRRSTVVDKFFKTKKHFGPPEWSFPPHVLLADATGAPLGLVTPHGRLDMPEFGKRTGAQRRQVQDAFLDRCAATLRSPGEMHLFYKYLVKYCYDSPLTGYPFLIGDKQNSGDVHQDAYQTLDRKIAGRFIVDCDDLAEFYQTVTRRQKRLSYVMGQPSHAICGFVEKDGKNYRFTTVDTGPPRRFIAANLDEAIEAGSSTFDDERSEAFDPNQICFLLRFAGEQTRTPYVLGTRMFIDSKYAKTLINVQRDWHFCFLASGRDTMIEMVKREKDPPTLFELSGLYRELHDWPKAIEWANKGIAAIPPSDPASRLMERTRIATYLMLSGDIKAAGKHLTATGNMIAESEKKAGKQAKRYLGMRLIVGGSLARAEQPWEAWKVLKPAINILVKEKNLSGQNLSRLADLLLEMRAYLDKGNELTAEQKAFSAEVEGLLTPRLRKTLFNEGDTSSHLMSKYSTLLNYYAAKHGRKAALEQLLAPGPYPTGPRQHHKRGRMSPELEAEDWKWIRTSIPAYRSFFYDALDPMTPTSKHRTEEASRILAALEKSLPAIKKRGPLGGFQFSLMTMRLKRDCIAKKWDAVGRTLDTMKQKNWGQLYRRIAMALGSSAAYMNADEFETQFRAFCDRKPPLPHYLRIAYEAMQVKKYDSALRAAYITAKLFPKNPEVQKEFKLFRQLIEKRTDKPWIPPEKRKPAPEAKPDKEKEKVPAEAPGN
jgi:hypothetical protein